MLPSSGKLLAWFALINGALTIATPFLVPIVANRSLSPAATVFFLGIGAISFIAGVFGLRAKGWAFWLLFVLFFSQLAEYQSERFLFSLIGPLSLKFGLVWQSPPSRLNFNLLALAICAFSAAVASNIAINAKADGSK